MFSFFLILQLSILSSCNIPQQPAGKIITPGETISTDEVEFFVSECFIVSITDYLDLGVNINLPVKDNSLLFIITGEIKNISPSSISLVDNINAKLLFDNKFSYDLTIEPNEKLNNIVPLSTEKFVFFASVPNEVLKTTNNFEYQIQFQKDLAKNKDKISLIGKNSRYGSAEGIVNFATFYEWVSPVLNKYSGIKVSVEEEIKTIRIKWDHKFNIFYPEPPEKQYLPSEYSKNYSYRHFAFIPELWIQYYNFIDNEGAKDSKNGFISFAFDTDQSYADYSSAENFSLILNNQIIECDDSLEYKTGGKVFVDGMDFDEKRHIFYFRSREKIESLSQIKKYDDLKLSLYYRDAALDNIFNKTDEEMYTTYESTLDDEWKDAISVLSNIYFDITNNMNVSE